MAKAETKSKRTRRGDNSRKAAIYEAVITFPGVEQLEGTIEKVSEQGVTFSYNRYGSRFQQFFPSRLIVACIGATDSKESMIWHMTNAKSLWSTGKRDRGIPLVSEPAAYGQHLLKSASPDFPTVLMGQAYASIIGKTTTGTRGRKKGSGSKAATTNGKSDGKKKKSRRGSKEDWAE